MVKMAWNQKLTRQAEKSSILYRSEYQSFCIAGNNGFFFPGKNILYAL